MKPFLTGKRSIDAAPLCVPQIPKSRPTPGAVRTLAEGPTVDVVKQGDKIVRIVVTCACGEKVEVECLYPAGS
jgi:hypothetical protein